MELDIEKENGLVTVFVDDNVFIFIDMTEKSVRTIFSTFDPYVQAKVNKELSIEVTEDNETFVLDFILSQEVDDMFALTCCVKGYSQYHEFDIEYCDIDTWNKIGTL